MTDSRKKIILIRPKNTFNYYNYPPLNLICLGSVLEADGFQVVILDAGRMADFDQALEANLKGALFVAIGMLTSEVPHAIEIMKMLRECSDISVVVGGWHCTLFPEQMADSALVDYVVVGEGEEPLLHLAREFAGGRKPEQMVQARVYHDMEKFPAPDYTLVPQLETYITNYLTDRLAAYVPQPIRWLPYDSSRGCPSRCTFCINVVTQNQKYRKKSAAKVLQETGEMVDRYKLTHLKIIDDNYFVDIHRVREIAGGFIERGQHESVTYDCECRCDYFNDRMLNDETLALLRKSGLVQLTLGIESGSDNTLKIMKKGITVDQARRAIEMCDRHGIIARSSFMIEVPGQTRADIIDTISFINDMRQHPFFTCGLGTFRPYPRCELTTRLVADGHLQEPQKLEDWLEKKNIDMYTSSDLRRPWQIDPEFSENASHYINIESEVRLGLHQLSDDRDRDLLRLLVEIAKVRNRNMDYEEGFDTQFYLDFLKRFYERKSITDRQGEYPLSTRGIEEEKNE